MNSLDSPLLPPTEVGEVDSRKGTMVSSVFTLANAAVGCGVLAFPYAFAQAGWLQGSFFCILYAVILGKSMVILAQATEEYERKATTLKTTSFQDLCLALLGPWGKALVELSMLIFLFGSCCAYLIVVGDMIQPAINDMNLGLNITRGTAILCTGTVTMLPLSMLNTMAALQYSSAVAVLSIGYMVSMLVVRGVQNWDEHKDSLVMFNSNWHLLSSGDGSTRALLAVPIICFALQCHVQTPSVYSELQDASISKMKRIAAITMTLCMMLYLPAGTFGVLACGPATKNSGDIMECFRDEKNSSMQIARLCIATAAICAYPLNAFPARSALLSLSKFIRDRSHATEVQAEPLPDNSANFSEAQPGASYVTLDDGSNDVRGDSEPTATAIRVRTIVWYLASLAVALSVKSLSAVLGLLGSTVAVIVMFMVPSAILYQKYGRRFNAISLLLLVTGVFAMVIGMVTTIDGIVSS